MVNMCLYRYLYISALAAALAVAQGKPRARAVGVRLEGTPGPLNAITDVKGVEAGHTTLISGDSVRTGVTVVWPRGKASGDPVYGGFYAQNGNGDMTGTHWLDESGYLDGPVLITNTHSVGVVRDAFLAWLVKNKRLPGTNVFPGGFFTYPIVAETYDGFLNDINGFHVKPEHVTAALDGASGGAVTEGNVGGGTGMTCYGFKGGIGTSSRRVQGGHTVGVPGKCNSGSQRQLRIGGLSVGEEISPPSPARVSYRGTGLDLHGGSLLPPRPNGPRGGNDGTRAHRIDLGNSSGDIFIAFSTERVCPGKNVSVTPNEALN
jgi:L-aminopeptidase/D-esterase-like protein